MSTNPRLNRRRFLKLVSAGTCGAAIHQMISPMSSMVALAEPVTSAAIGTNPILIVINLSGGCSYNIAPVYHSAYRDKNPTISYGPNDSLALSAEQGLHPALTAFKQVFDEGHLGLVNMVGYPNPNRSHAESTDIWFSGMRGMAASMGGWGARLTCQMNSIFAGVSLSGSNLLISGDCNPPRSFGSLNQDAFGEDAVSGVWGEHLNWFKVTRDNMLYDADPDVNSSSKFVRTEMQNLELSTATIKQATNRALPSIAPIAFPNSGFGQACRDAAKLLNAPELNTHFVFLQRGGFDTHAGERAALNGNLTDINGGVRALIATAKALGRWNDVIIVTMSEFCRTFENGSQGTDHGHAAPMLVAGGGVRGGIITPVPTPAETLASDFYRDYHVDFRGVLYEAVKAMGYNAAPIFPEPFAYSQLGLFA